MYTTILPSRQFYFHLCGSQIPVVPHGRVPLSLPNSSGKLSEFCYSDLFGILPPRNRSLGRCRKLHPSPRSVLIVEIVQSQVSFEKTKKGVSAGRLSLETASLRVATVQALFP